MLVSLLLIEPEFPRTLQLDKQNVGENVQLAAIVENVSRKAKVRAISVAFDSLLRAGFPVFFGALSACRSCFAKRGLKFQGF